VVAAEAARHRQEAINQPACRQIAGKLRLPKLTIVFCLIDKKVDTPNSSAAAQTLWLKQGA